jgi:predicted flap endonuclease-1-like 5' DNA nuclease
MVEANWLAFALALLLGLLIAWWLFARGSKGGTVRERRPDVLDEGAEPAKRNQALIDAPSAAAAITPSAAAGTLGGLAEAVAVGAQDVVEDAEATAAASAPAPQEPAPEPAGEADDLRRIKGVGPKLVALLHSLGVNRYEQIAAWSEEDIDRIDAQLGTFAGRIRRDSWVEQARFLAAGDTAGFEGQFGKL